MNNDIFNLRVWAYHIQISKGFGSIRAGYNKTYSFKSDPFIKLFQWGNKSFTVRLNEKRCHLTLKYVIGTALNA